MDIRSLHATFVASGAAAAHAQIVAANEVKSQFVQADTVKYIASHGQEGPNSINWPRVLRELARVNNPGSA